MFIYYSLHAMDEMIELFSVVMQLEKGALGLFFELNYLIGLFNAGHCIFFHFKHKLKAAAPLAKDTADGKWNDALEASRQHSYDQLENFLTFQYYYSFACLVMLLVVWGMYSRMNSKAKNVGKTHVSEDKDNINYAINKD
jgi:hypothetical protein